MEDLLPNYGINIGMTKPVVEVILKDKTKYGDKYLIDNSTVKFYYDGNKSDILMGLEIELLDKEKVNTSLDELRIGSYEKQILDLANVSRVQNGLKPLLWNTKTANIARKHSQDMADNNYFNHISLDGRTPWDRLEQENVNFMIAGENIAM